MRGLSDEYGSWNTTCSSRRHRPHLALRSSVVDRAGRASWIAPAVGSLQPQDQLAGGRLAAARLADEAERLAARDREADAVDRVHLAAARPNKPCSDRVVLAQVAHLEQQSPSGGASCARLASRAPRSASPIGSQQAAQWPGAVLLERRVLRARSARSRAGSAARTGSRAAAPSATAPCRGSRPGACARLRSTESPRCGIEPSSPRV